MQAISQHPHHRPIHLSKAEMPATRGLGSKIASFPRVLLVKSSWASTPSTLPLLKINELIVLDHLGCPRSSPLRTTQHYYFCISRRTKARSSKTSGGRLVAGPDMGTKNRPGMSRAACSFLDRSAVRLPFDKRRQLNARKSKATVNNAAT